LIPDATFDGSAIRTALQCLVGLMAEDAGIRRCLLFIPTKGNIQSTTLEEVLGEKFSKLLSDGKDVRLGEGALRLETFRTFQSYTSGDAVVVVYADQKMMDAVDSNRSLKAVICVPHLPDAVEDWKRTWNPISPGSKHEEVRLIGNPVVEAALASMTGRINLSYRVLHPSDTEAVKDAFRILRAHRQTEEPANIRAWCIKHGWHAGAADEAMKYAAKAFALRSKPSVQGTRWAADIYDQWVRTAAGTTV
jgi:hypothetical protein